MRIGTVFRFGDFELDLQVYELRQAGKALRLQKMPLDLLILFAGRQGELVTRQDIIDRLWGPDVFLDADRAINNTIRKLRVVLGDDAEKPKYLETVIGKGYRFIAAVSVVDETAEPTSAAAGDAPAPPEAMPVPLPRRRPWPLVLTGVLALLAAAGVFVWQRARSPRVLRSIAVLPLANLTGDPAQEYFVDGMTDALITDLAKIPDLKVISRTSIMRFKKTTRPLPEIARELGVDGIVEGSCVRDGARVRVTSQLIDASTDRHLWAENFERELGDVVSLQGEISRSIAEQIRPLVSLRKKAASSAPRAAPSAEAHEAYLMGRYHWNRRTREELTKAIAYFETAIARSPVYAEAYVGLANSYGVMGSYLMLKPADAYARSEAAARKALELDPSLGEAFAALGYARLLRDFDIAGAERDLVRAIELSPNDASAHVWYAHCLAARGRSADAVHQAEKARDIDPLSVAVNRNLGRHLTYARRYAAAVRSYEKVLELEPGQALALHALGVLHQLMGHPDLALRETKRAVEISGGAVRHRLGLAWVEARNGDRNAARAAVEDAARGAGAAEAPADVAQVYAALEDVDEAFRWLDKAFEERDERVLFLGTNPVFDVLRKDARYEQLLRRIRRTG